MALIWLRTVIAEEMGFIGLGGFSPLSPSLSLVALVMCALIGGLGAYIFVLRITTGWAAASRGVR
jgi:hypothetical protein